jgi:hemerythrin-like domain-containing protein
MSDDVVDRIEHDHREVEELFTEFDSTNDRAIALKICDELEIHARAEEKEVYPVIREELSMGPEEIDEAVHEHDHAEDLIAQVRSAQGQEIVGLMAELRQAIEQHVMEEESEMLPHARAELPEQELEELGERFEDAKEHPAR